MATLLGTTTIGGHQAIHVGNISNYAGISQAAADGRYLLLSGGTLSGNLVFPNNSAVGLQNADGSAGFRPDDQYGNIYTWNSSGGYYVDANGYYLRNTTGSVNWLSITGSGTVQANADFRAPIFYDSADTGYYIDPNSTSNIVTLYASTLYGSDVYTNGGWFRNHSNNNGIYWSGTSWHLMPENSSDFRIHSGNSSESALRIETNGTTRGYVYANSSNEIGFLNNGRTWRLRVYSGGAVESYGDFRAPIFYDSADTNYYVDPNSNSKLVNLGLGGATPDVRLSVSGDGHISGYLYLGGSAGSASSWGVRTVGTSGSWITNSNTVRFDNIGYGNNWSFNINSAGAVTINRHLDANTSWGTAGVTALFVGWYGGKIILGNNNDGGHDYANAAPGNSLISTNKHYFYKGVSMQNNVQGAEVLSVDGINGRLFTVTDDLSDSLFSVNTIAGLPVIEAFADNSVKIGKYGSNSITIANSRIAINSDTVDTNFPFYVGDRSTSGSRYSLANPGMGFNLADNYAQLQLYGGNGGYIDFTTSSGQDSGGRIMWNGGSFTISGDMYFNNTLYTYTLYDRNDGNYYLDMNGTSRLGTVNVNQLSVYGNTYLGDGNGDATFINDTLYIGANDSGDSHLYFGEGGSPGSDYGAHWYWDSSYTFYWYTRNAGTDRALFNYATNDTTYLYWHRHFHMNNYEINYLNQIHFNDNVWFVDDGNNRYLNYRWGNSSEGGIKFVDGDGSLQGYVYGSGGGSFGLLDAGGNWKVRIDTSNVEFYGTQYATNLYANVFYDRDDSGYYADFNSTSNSAIRVRGGTLHGPNPTWGKYLYVGTDGRVGTNASVAVTNGNLHIDAEDGYSLYLNWYNTSNIYTRSNLGVGSDTADFRLHVHGTGFATSDFRAPIFYDSNNTNYYGDFASTSVMNAIRFGTSTNNATLSGNSDWGIRLTNDSGYIQFGPANGSYAHIYTDRGSFYFNKNLEVNGNTVATQVWVQSQGYLTGSHNHDDRYYTESESDGRYLYYRGMNQETDFQRFVDTPGVVRFDQANATGGFSNAPGGYTYGGVLSLRGVNFGFQLWGSHTGDLFYKTQWENDNYTGWRSIITELNIGSQSVNYAASAGSVAWTNVSGRPTTVSAFTNDSGYITSSGRAYPRRSDGGDLNFYWSGQSGQPTWLWGGTDGVNMYVYNPSNFSVNYATSAGNATTANGANGNFYIDDNYGVGVVGLYSAERYQGVFAMGDAYKLSADGTSTGSLYGIAWTHTNVGGESKAGLGHQALFMMNGRTYTAIGSGIWTDGTITTTSHGTSANWNTAYGWGNHASAGYQSASTAITTSNIGSQSVNYASSAGSAGSISVGVGGGTEANLVYATVADNDFFRIRVGGSSNAGFVEIATADDGTEPIYVRQYTGVFSSLTRTATILDGSGNTNFPGTVYAAGYRGNANVGGTGEAAWFPAGLYSGSTQWLYGTMYRNGSDTYHAGGSLYQLGFVELNNGFRISQGGSNYGVFNSWVRLDGYYGFYSSINSAHLQPNDYSYGSWKILGERNGWRGIHFGEDSGMTLMMNETEFGFHRQGQGWAARFTAGFFDGTASYANSAGSATTADQIDGWGFRNTGSNSGTNADTIESNGITYYTSGVSNFSGNATDGALYSQAYSSSWQHQIAGDYRSGQIAVRGKNSGTWQSWRTVLDSSNYSSWAIARGGDTVTGIINFLTNNGGKSGDTDSAKLQAYSTSNNAAFMSFHKAGVYAINFGLDDDNVMRMGGWSAPRNLFQMDMSGNLTMAGDVIAFSDARVKTNVQTIEGALEKTLKLRGVTYNRTDHADTSTKLGVIAQEVLEVIPEVVTLDNNGTYGVSYGNIVGLLIEAIKEQQAQIDDLKKQLNK